MAKAPRSPRTAELMVAGDDGARRVRLTYVMALRVGLVTLFLAAALVAELGAPVTERSPVVDTLWTMIAATYGLTIVFALALTRRVRKVTGLAMAQIAGDLALTTMLVHLTGGADSGFAFMYLLVVIGAAFVMPRGALAVAAAAVVLYIGDGVAFATLPWRTLIRTLAVNGIAIAATGALATRLALELERAGAQVVSQGVLLRDLAAVHEHVVRGLTSGLVTVDRDGRVLTLNNAAATILERPTEAALGRPITEVMPGIGPLLALAGDGRLRRGETVQPVQRDGDTVESRTLGVSVSPLVDSAGRVLGRILNFQDLTEVRRLETAVLRAERLAAVGQLAAGVAHEIRNPLAAISGSIELLSQSLSDDATRENRELMSIVLREVDRLNRLISDLLGFARPRSADTQRLDVAAALSEMVRVFENDRGLGMPRVELRAPDAVWIDADAAQLRQVMWNLLRNAAEAAPGELVTVDVAADAAGGARVTVRDRGPGMPAEVRARVGEPFFSTKEGGTGLGLATVHRIVEEHRGAMEIDCPAAGGTVVTIRLPAGGAAEHAAAPHAPAK